GLGEVLVDDRRGGFDFAHAPKVAAEAIDLTRRGPIKPMHLLLLDESGKTRRLLRPSHRLYKDLELAARITPRPAARTASPAPAPRPSPEAERSSAPLPPTPRCRDGARSAEAAA